MQVGLRFNLAGCLAFEIRQSAGGLRVPGRVRLRMMYFLSVPRGDVLGRGLLPHKIQDREDISIGTSGSNPRGSVPRTSGSWMGADKYLDSDGNRVNVGNFDDKGLNVNNNWDDNRNENLGLASARQSSLHLEPPPGLVRVFLSAFPG